MKKFYRDIIITNKAQCLICHDIIESKHGYDFVTCSCGNVSVDGGTKYLRRAVHDGTKFKDLSEVIKEEREPYEWEESGYLGED
jgi:hypothetical protein